MNDFFYIDSQNRQMGPVNPSDFSNLGISAETKVWRAGMSEWQAAGTVPELASIFNPVNAAPETTPFNPGQPSPAPQVPPIVPPNPVHNPSAYGTQPPVMDYSQKPDNLLVWSILVTVLCCLPLGIVSIIQSNKVDRLWKEGDYMGSQQAAKSAKTFILISAIVGFIVTIFAIIGQLAS